jgi:alpha-amylase/alpha-mannosidase (GH57 family)
MIMRAVALHLHHYQPPRENPWLDVVPREPSAAPFHDWNERITAECYRPQTAARLLDDGGSIADTCNVFEHCSFDVGPTLHHWLAEHAVDVDAALRAGDRAATPKHHGHGTAIAHPYVHAILPLASDRDRSTLVRWGIADFRARFGRDPEGMWLPETAVDLNTLEALADAGIGYTILAPQQIARTRTLDGEWQQIEPGTIDPTRPYRVALPSGRSMTVCVFDGPLSQSVAFDRALLSDGDALARALLDGFRDREGPQLLVVATDGETYGHHHRFGEMALAQALANLEADPSVELVTPGEFLSRFPAEHEAEIVAPSSWSCAHGVGRWCRDCGCTTSSESGWNQEWRAPLRAAVDWLTDAVAGPWEAAATELLTDPWAARDAYVDVLLRPGAESRERFLREHAAADSADSSAQVWALMELQRHLLFTGTSCGWFFADPAALETAVVLRNAARVLDLAYELLGLDLEEELRGRLKDVNSNRPQEGDGTQLWRTWGRGAAFDDLDVAASWACLMLADPDAQRTHLLGRECRSVPMASGETPTEIDGVDADSLTMSGRLAVHDPATQTTSELVYAGSWNMYGGPFVVVANASPDLRTAATVTQRHVGIADLPDDVVAELLRVCLLRSDALTDIGSVVQQAAARGLDIRAEADQVADSLIVRAVAQASTDPHGPNGVVALEALLVLARNSRIDHGRFAAQNLVLAVRNDLAQWDADPARSAGASAIRRMAERLGVSVPDRT